ncbi:hypothetical protein B0H13DRAFT_2665456 [Mycena leptocephala]|nr:hypothetical protein B0H13DRAFT_2665456 [Mycena leptocephala]
MALWRSRPSQAPILHSGGFDAYPPPHSAWGAGASLGPQGASLRFSIGLQASAPVRGAGTPRLYPTVVRTTSPGADAKGEIDQSTIKADGRDGDEVRFFYISFFCFSSDGIPSYPFPLSLLPFLPRIPIVVMYCSSAQLLRPRGAHAKGEFGLGAIEADAGEVRPFYISVFFGRKFRVSFPFHASSKYFGRAHSVGGVLAIRAEHPLVLVDDARDLHQPIGGCETVERMHGCWTLGARPMSA